MLALATERGDGAHTYFVPPEHTAVAREILGPDRLLVPEQVCVLSEDSTVAREIARRHTTSYLRLPNYTANLQRFGFEPDDFADGGNDRLVDTICAWGSIDAIAARVKAHLDAGADHVAVQILVDDRRGLPRREWAELAPALLAL
jgi:probable F420-dependent oxidoreductase